MPSNLKINDNNGGFINWWWYNQAAKIGQKRRFVGRNNKESALTTWCLSFSWRRLAPPPIDVVDLSRSEPILMDEPEKVRARPP